MSEDNGTVVIGSVSSTGFHKTVYDWNITNTVDKDEWDILTGDRVLSKFSIGVEKVVDTITYSVGGIVSVTNVGDFPTEGLEIVCQVQYRFGADPFIDLAGAMQTLIPSQLNPDQSGQFNYEIFFTQGQLALITNAELKVVASITILNYTGEIGVPFGPTVESSFTLTDDNQIINDCANVDDDNLQFHDNTCESIVYTVTKLYFGTTNNGVNVNEAIVTSETIDKSASSSVTINAQEIEFSLSAFTSLTRTYIWTVTKTVNTTELELPEGTCENVFYRINAFATPSDSNFVVFGDLFSENPTDIPIDIRTVSVQVVVLANDINTNNTNNVTNENIDDNIAENIDDNMSISTLIPYSRQVSSNIYTQVTVVFSYPFYQYSLNSNNIVIRARISTIITDISQSINFANAIVTPVDECVVIHDSTHTLPDNNLCYPTNYTVNYRSTICADCEHPDRIVNNTITLTSGDRIVGQASTNIHVKSICQVIVDCTHTVKYWETHSKYGPCEPNDTWNLIPGGAGPDTIFYLSNKTWFNILRLYGNIEIDLCGPCDTCNIYYALAVQYIAAVLNKLNGASSTAYVDASIAFAEYFFMRYSPNDVKNLCDGSNDIKKARTSICSLERYNDGIIGPGKCDDDCDIC